MEAGDRCQRGKRRGNREWVDRADVAFSRDGWAGESEEAVAGVFRAAAEVGHGLCEFGARVGEFTAEMI